MRDVIQFVFLEKVILKLMRLENMANSRDKETI